MSDVRPEDDYFARLELEKKRTMRKKRSEEQEASELKAMKELHFNKCGKCGDEMETVPFRGVEVEICPSCGAVLLDSGELQTLAGEDNGGVISNFFTVFFGNSDS